MQVVKAKIQDGVFIPLTSVDFKDEEDMEVIVIINKKITKKREISVIDSQSKAKEYFQKKFPDLDVNNKILDLVGILRDSSTRNDKEEYYEYLEKKYK